jgi:hypothetical protein
MLSRTSNATDRPKCPKVSSGKPSGAGIPSSTRIGETLDSTAPGTEAQVDAAPDRVGPARASRLRSSIIPRTAGSRRPYGTTATLGIERMTRRRAEHILQARIHTREEFSYLSHALLWEQQRGGVHILIMARTNGWVIAAAIAALIVGAILSRVIEPGVRVEKVMLTGNTPALRLFPATPGPHPIVLLAHGRVSSNLPNYALQRTRPSRSGCNPRLPGPGR